MKHLNMHEETMEILLVEDNEGDVELTFAAFEEANIPTQLQVVRDGEEALDYLYCRGNHRDKKRPHVVLLDLNLPKISGREILQEIKTDDQLRSIPVIVLTSSEAEKDILESYNLHANCYIVKPVEWEKFVCTIKGLECFWGNIVNLPA